ncbi:MAG: LPS export ABC transporter periplasmic protein LptC [Pyrinomonadaceae bacterium]
MPLYFRIAAVAAILIAVIVVGIGFYRERSKAAFKLKSEHTQLSDQVVTEVNGYERRETDDGVTKYFIKADHAKTFLDNHLELQNVYLELYGSDGVTIDRMSAESALYIPEEDKNFTTYLKGNVQIETRDALKVNTNDITYTRRTETADIAETVSFERENIRGRSFGATVKMAEKRLDLLKDVEIETFESAELARSNVRYAKINAGSGIFDQLNNKIDLNSHIEIKISAKDRNSDAKAARALVNFAGSDARTRHLKKFELFENVLIVSTVSGGSPTNIESGYALYEKDSDRYELKNGTHIVSMANGKQTDIRSTDAIYEQGAGKLALTGGAEIVQGSDVMKGDVLYANLFPDLKVKDAVIRGSASVQQSSPERVLNISAPEMNASFTEARQMHDANAIGQSTVELVPAKADGYTSVKTTAVRGIGLVFKGEGLLDTLKTDGRTTIQLNVPQGERNAANKRVTADSIKTIFNTNGKDIKKAEAVGNAELFIDPLVADRRNNKTTINGPRFDCDFFPTGNNAQSCVAGKKAKAVRVPTVPVDGKGSQSIDADVLTAKFSEQSSDIELLEANGNAKFTELERNGIAKQISFTQADEIVRLRGGEPTVWDLRGRAKAREIDIDTRNDRSFLRGGVSTTYYSQKQIKGSTPFGSSDKPVFLTGDSAEFDHKAENAVYTGNARAWQENNYIRGNRLFIDQAGGKFQAEGNVQSLIYNAKLRTKGKENTVPTSASAGSLAFDREKRILQYRTSVDIRQGTDRITSASADIYLDENNDVIRTVAETNVIISQPNRRASGDWAEYSAGTETAILRGSPATVTDPENGSSQSAQITFSMRDNRVTTEGGTKQNSSGRIRSVYKIKELKP